MISYIKGIVEEVTESSLIIETGGIGYEVFATASCFDKYGFLKSEVRIFTYMNVKEDSVSLFGFLNVYERNMFLRLITVAGIGPKTAMQILSSLKVEDIARCVTLGDAMLLSRVKGIGKKTAERIILELKDKVSKEFNEIAAKSGIMPDRALNTGIYDDAVIALMSLGYSKGEAAAVMSKTETKGLTPEEIVYKVLKG